jgi:hypothetical protein
LFPPIVIYPLLTIEKLVGRDEYGVLVVPFSTLRIVGVELLAEAMERLAVGDVVPIPTRLALV